MLLLLALATVACGVPISAEDLDLTATVEPTSLAASTPPASSRTAAVSTAPETPTATAAASASPTATFSAFVTPAPSATASLYATPVPPVSTGNMAADVIQILNSYRTSQGLPALRANATLSADAAAYARLMADYSWFLNYRSDPHTGPDGSSPESRAAASGYGGRWRGEALSAGQTSAQSAINTWLASPPHAAILLDSYAVEVGVGYYFRADDVYGHYWVLVSGVQ